MFESPYANPNNSVSDDNKLLTLVSKDRLEANDVALAEGLGVVDDVVEVASVALPSSSSAMGTLGMACSVGCVLGVAAAIELGTWLLACILNEAEGSGVVGVGVTFACRTYIIVY